MIQIKKIKLFALLPKIILSSIVLVFTTLTGSCNNNLDELDSKPATTNLNNFSSYNTKTIVSPVGGQGFSFPETALFVNGKLLKKAYVETVIDASTSVASTITNTIYSSMLKVSVAGDLYPSFQMFELPDAVLDMPLEFVLTPGFTDTPENLEKATPAGRTVWQTKTFNLKKGAGQRLVVYKKEDGTAAIQLIKNADGVDAPKPGYFKFRVLNLSTTAINTSLASGYDLPSALNEVASGTYSDVVELPYGSFRFLFKNTAIDAAAKRENTKATLQEKINPLTPSTIVPTSTINPQIPFLPQQEFSSDIKVSISSNTAGAPVSFLPYGASSTSFIDGDVDAVEQAYYPGGIYTAVIYPKDDTQLLFAIMMDNLRNFSPQKNIGKITLVNGTTNPITASFAGATVNLSSGAFSVPQVLMANTYSIQSAHGNMDVNIQTGRNLYLFAIETAKGEKKWLPVDYPTSPNASVQDNLFSTIYTRYINLSPDAGTVDFVCKSVIGSGSDITTNLGLRKWEGQNLTFAETLQFYGKTFAETNKPIEQQEISKIFGEYFEVNSGSNLRGSDIKAIGVASSISSGDEPDAPGRLIASVPFFPNPFGANPIGASYTILLIGKTKAAPSSSEAAKVIVHRHLF